MTFYNGIHPFLGETQAGRLWRWISTLDKAWKPVKRGAVVAGTTVARGKYDAIPCLIGGGRDAEISPATYRPGTRATTTGAPALREHDASGTSIPDSVNPGSLWVGANAAEEENSEANTGRPSRGRTTRLTSCRTVITKDDCSISLNRDPNFP